MAHDITMLELVHAVSQRVSSEAETIATVAYLVNSGAYRLCGNFRGMRIELDGPSDHPHGGQG